MHANIDVHSRILIAEFTGDEIKCIEKLQAHCSNITFLEKVGMIEPSRKSDIKEGNYK